MTPVFRVFLPQGALGAVDNCSVPVRRGNVCVVRPVMHTLFEAQKAVRTGDRALFRRMHRLTTVTVRLFYKKTPGLGTGVDEVHL